MKVVCQRVLESSVTVDNKKVSQIKEGLLLLVGFSKEDTIDNVKIMAKKIVNLRIFDDEEGIMNKSLLEENKEILSVSQFTLHADTSKGNRPSYINAMKSDEARNLYKKFNEELRTYTNKVQEGIFQADMKVSLINDGPITIILEK